MKLNDYAKWTANTCAELDTRKEDITHMLLGIITETGELADIFKKSLAYGKEIDWVNVEEELGDIMFYLASFCRINNLDFEKIINTNVLKLESRYPEKFTEYHALNRDLEKEREILETSGSIKASPEEEFKENVHLGRFRI
jgi:NTP pyrophosphatase (non-canonical NTP hydrolase)